LDYQNLTESHVKWAGFMYLVGTQMDDIWRQEESLHQQRGPRVEARQLELPMGD
jgi:hypothetical protein